MWKCAPRGVRPVKVMEHLNVFEVLSKLPAMVPLPAEVTIGNCWVPSRTPIMGSAGSEGAGSVLLQAVAATKPTSSKTEERIFFM